VDKLQPFLEQARAIVADAHARYPHAEGLFNGRLAVQPSRSGAPQRAQRFHTKVGNIAYSAALSPTLGGLPREGYATALHLVSLQQVVSGATAPVIGGLGAYGPLYNIAIQVSNRQPYNLYGFEANAFAEIFYAPYKDTETASPLVTSSTNNWINDVWIPMTISPDSEIGAWYLNDPELTVDLAITGGTTAQAFSTVNAATIQGSWDVYVERFSAPAPDQPGGWINEVSYYVEHKFFGSYQLKNGETIIYLDRDRDYARIMLIFFTGAHDATFAPAAGLFTTVELQIGDTISVIKPIAEQELRDEMLRNYAWSTAGSGTKNLRPGVYCLDFLVQKQFHTLSRRDILPTDSAITNQVALRIVSTSASNNVDVVVSYASDNPFAQKWVASAAAKGALKAA